MSTREPFDARREAHRFIVCRPNIGGPGHNGICDDLTAALQAAYERGGADKFAAGLRRAAEVAREADPDLDSMADDFSREVMVTTAKRMGTLIADAIEREATRKGTPP